MNLTAGMKPKVAASSATLLAGLALSAHGVIRDDVPRSLGGACVVLTGLSMIVLSVIYSWVVDTRDERIALNAAQRTAVAERSRYLALQAALELEQGRLNQDMAAERVRVARTLVEERESLRVQFEKERRLLQRKAFLMGVEMERSGALKPDEPVALADLIPFPEQGAQVHERARSREH